MRPTLLLLSLLLPGAALADEALHRVKQGQPAPVDGWVYPLSEHSRIIADFKALDVALDGAQADLDDALEQLATTHDTIDALQQVEVELHGRLIAAELMAEAHAGDARRHALYWGLACGLSVAIPWAGAELSYMDRSTAASAAAFGLSATALLAWLTGG